MEVQTVQIKWKFLLWISKILLGSTWPSGENRHYRFKAGFLNVSRSDIVDTVILCCEALLKDV